MVLTTTHTVEGRGIREYLGVVCGEAIVSPNILRDLFASVRDIVGGRAAAYEEELQKAREIATENMVNRARQLGADAVVGIDLDYTTMSNNMMVVGISGTAIRLTKK